MERECSDFCVRANQPINQVFCKSCRAGVSPAQLGQAGCLSHKIPNTPNGNGKIVLISHRKNPNNTVVFAQRESNHSYDIT